VPNFSYVEITEGFVEAVRTWSEYLSKGRDWSWGTFGAREFFRDAFSTFPRRPATAEEIEALAWLGSQASIDPKKAGPKWTKRFSRCDALARPYLSSELNRSLTHDRTASPSKTTLNDAIELAKTKAADPNASIDVPPQVDNPGGGVYTAPDTDLNERQGSKKGDTEWIPEDYAEPPPGSHAAEAGAGVPPDPIVR